MDTHFPSPAAGFDHPLEILDGCHERILRNCALVERIAAHVERHGADAEAATAAASVLRYFDTAGRDHHRDEEDDLFPAMQQVAPSEDLNAVFDLVHRLKDDHDRLEALWAGMRARLVEIAAGRDGHVTPDGAAQLTAAYERHIALEESQLLPLARRILGEDILRALGERMARRRGVQLGLAP